MKIEEFNVLYAIHKWKDNRDTKEIAERTGYTEKQTAAILQQLTEKRWL